MLSAHPLRFLPGRSCGRSYGDAVAADGIVVEVNKNNRRDISSKWHMFKKGSRTTPTHASVSVGRYATARVIRQHKIEKKKFVFPRAACIPQNVRVPDSMFSSTTTNGPRGKKTLPNVSFELRPGTTGTIFPRSDYKRINMPTSIERAAPGQA